MDIPSTGIALVDVALRLLAQHAYLITFAATILENLLVVGSFTPGETVVLAAGFVASLSDADAISPLAVFAVAVLGSFVGSNVSYAIGLRGGRPFLERYGHRFALGERRLRDAEGFFERHGSKTILFGRFAPGIKNFAPVIAGASRMNVAVFEAYTLAGSVVYSAMMVVLGYFFGSNFQSLLKMVNRAGWVVFGLILLAVTAAWVWERRRLIARREALDLRAEEAAEAGRHERD